MTESELNEIERHSGYVTEIQKLIQEIRRLKLGPSEEEIGQAVSSGGRLIYWRKKSFTQEDVELVGLGVEEGIRWRSSWNDNQSDATVRNDE